MRKMKKINFALALTTLLNSLITRADFTVEGITRSPGRYSGTTILAAVIIIVIILILLYIKFIKKSPKSKSKK